MNYNTERIKEILDTLNITSYPILADTGATAPFATYRRTDLEATKDDVSAVWYEITMVGDTYATSITMLLAAFACEAWEVTDTGEEDYNDGYYLQRLTVRIDM